MLWWRILVGFALQMPPQATILAEHLFFNQPAYNGRLSSARYIYMYIYISRENQHAKNTLICIDVQASMTTACLGIDGRLINGTAMTSHISSWANRMSTMPFHLSIIGSESSMRTADEFW